MTIDERRIGSVTILDLHGKITLGEGDDTLKDGLHGRLALGRRHFLINFQDVPYIDHAGLGEIVRGYVSVRRHRGQLKLLNLNKRLKELFKITKLDTRFEAFDDEAKALASFEKI